MAPTVPQYYFLCIVESVLTTAPLNSLLEAALLQQSILAAAWACSTATVDLGFLFASLLAGSCLLDPMSFSFMASSLILLENILQHLPEKRCMED